ncbi:hypothetical protein MRX96_032636 [Rhipicephalus microplus]
MPFLMQVFVLLFAPLLHLGFLGNHRSSTIAKARPSRFSRRPGMPLHKKPRGCRFRRPLASASGNTRLLQVSVLLFAPLLRLGFLGNHPFLDYCQSAPVTIQSLAWNAFSQETPRIPFPSAARFCVWQHRATTSLIPKRGVA